MRVSPKRYQRDGEFRINKNIMTKKKFLTILHVVALVALFSAPSLIQVQALDLGLDKVKETGLSDWGAGAGGREGVLTLITNLIKILLGVAGAVAVLFIIIGGFQFITSAANPSGAKEGKETLKNAIIGLIIIILSYVIVSAVANFVSTSPTGSGGGTLPPAGGGGGPKPIPPTKP